MSDGAQQEMTLDRYLLELLPSHRARKELDALRAKVSELENCGSLAIQADCGKCLACLQGKVVDAEKREKKLVKALRDLMPMGHAPNCHYDAPAKCVQACKRARDLVSAKNRTETP